MSPENAASNLFVTSQPLAGIDAARALIGRVVAVHVMSEANPVIPHDTLRERENIHSLSMSRDLISIASEDALKNLDEHLKKQAEAQ